MNKIEKEYWDFSKGFSFYNFLNPINVENCKVKFFQALEEEKVFNPIFEYHPLDFNTKSVLKKLEKFKQHFQKSNDFEGEIYVQIIDENIAWITNISKRNHPSFSTWLSSLYGRPGNKNYYFAKQEIKELKKAKYISKFMSANKAEDEINKELKKRNYDNWKTELKDIVAKMYIDSPNNKIIINQNRQFDKRELQRLIVHEIDTHVLRHENGKKQNSLIYAYGLPSYITTEEGLALYSEYKSNLLSNNDLTKYCTRLIAAHKSFSLGFYELFNHVENFVDKGLAFDITVRIKRGLIDTEEKGGFTKDQVYYRGFRQVKKLSLKKIRQLYIGKIGINDIPNIPNISQKMNANLEIPMWLKKEIKKT